MRLHKTGSSDWSNRGYKHKQCALADRGISYYLLFRSLRSARWMSDVAGISTVCHTIVKTARVSFGISALQGTDWLTTTIVFLRLVSYLHPGKRANKQKPFLSSRCISLPSFLAPLPLRCASQIYFLSKVCVCMYLLRKMGSPIFCGLMLGCLARPRPGVRNAPGRVHPPPWGVEQLQNKTHSSTVPHSPCFHSYQNSVQKRIA